MNKIWAAVIIHGVFAGSAAATDRVGYRAIAAGDFAAAAQRLEAERRIHPQRPELMLNLAAAYRRIGKLAEAQALYATVMAKPAVTLDLPNGRTASSHALAAAGQARIAPVLAKQ